VVRRPQSEGLSPSRCLSGRAGRRRGPGPRLRRRKRPTSTTPRCCRREDPVRSRLPEGAAASYRPHSVVNEAEGNAGRDSYRRQDPPSATSRRSAVTGSREQPGWFIYNWTFWPPPGRNPARVIWHARLFVYRYLQGERLSPPGFSFAIRGKARNSLSDKEVQAMDTESPLGSAPPAAWAACRK
jgi:hypothetical protein